MNGNTTIRNTKSQGPWPDLHQLICIMSQTTGERHSKQIKKCTFIFSLLVCILLFSYINPKQAYIPSDPWIFTQLQRVHIVTLPGLAHGHQVFDDGTCAEPGNTFVNSKIIIVIVVNQFHRCHQKRHFQRTKR